jgi:hypothetical protein
MKSSQQNRRVARAPWRTVTCVMLIGLLLYNPFFSLMRLSGNASYDGLARHRATVGASEMQHFSPVSAISELPDAEVKVSTVEPVKPAAASLLEEVHPIASPLRQEILAGVWFRPPPSL